MWVPMWGSSRVDVGADVGFVLGVRSESDKDQCGGLHPGSILTPPLFRLFASWRDGVSGPFPGPTRHDRTMTYRRFLRSNA